MKKLICLLAAFFIAVILHGQAFYSLALPEGVDGGYGYILDYAPRYTYIKTYSLQQGRTYTCVFPNHSRALNYIFAIKSEMTLRA